MIGSAGPEQVADREPLAYRVVRGGLWVALSSYFNLGFGFLANLVLTRLLAPEDFGVFALALFFSALIGLRPKLDVGQAFAQRKDTTGDLLGTHMVLDVAAASASVALALLAMPVLRVLGYSQDVARVVLAIAVVGLPVAATSTAWVLLDKSLLFGRTSLVSSLAFPVSYVPAFWLALHGGGYWSLVAQNATYALLLLAGMWWVARQRLPGVFRLRWRFDRTAARQLLRFGSMVGLGSLAVMLVGQFDNWLVGTFVGLATLGFYDRAYRIAQWPSTLVSSVLARTAFYTYARLQDDPERLAKSVTMTCWLLALLATPVALVIFVSAPDLVSLLYGARWMPSVPFVRFLVVYSLLRPLIDVAGSLFVAVGRPKLSTLASALQFGALAVVATPLTLRYGATGTCIGVGVAFAVGLAAMYHYTHRVVSLSLMDTLGIPVAAAVLSAVLCLLARQATQLGALPLAVRIAAQSSLALALFALTAVAWRPRAFAGRVAYLRRLFRGA